MNIEKYYWQVDLIHEIRGHKLFSECPLPMPHDNTKCNGQPIIYHFMLNNKLCKYVSSDISGMTFFETDTSSQKWLAIILSKPACISTHLENKSFYYSKFCSEQALSMLADSHTYDIPTLISMYREGLQIKI